MALLPAILLERRVSKSTKTEGTPILIRRKKMMGPTVLRMLDICGTVQAGYVECEELAQRVWIGTGHNFGLP
jgi:hypothetical protein